jgi:hypothetical protein
MASEATLEDLALWFSFAGWRIFEQTSTSFTAGETAFPTIRVVETADSLCVMWIDLSNGSYTHYAKGDFASIYRHFVSDKSSPDV